MSFKDDKPMKKSRKVKLPMQGSLTVEKLRTYKGFENSTQEDAVKEIEVIKRLARIMYNMYMADIRKRVSNEK